MAYERHALARMTTASTGSTTSPIVLGAAVPPYKTFAAAGVSDGALVRYFILDGNNSEEQLQIYTASGTSLARGTPVDGAARITLSGTAQVVLSPGPDDFSALLVGLADSGMQINGSMEVSQENGATAVTGITNSAPYVVDGVIVAAAGTMIVTAQQVADAPAGYTKSLKITVTTAEAVIGANDYCLVIMPIEGYRVSRLGLGASSAQSLSIGFWTKIHRAGTYSGSVRNGALARSYPFSFTQNVADTWEWKTVTLVGDTTGTWLTTTGIGMEVDFALASGANLVGTANAWAASNLVAATGTTNGVAATSDVFQITGVVLLPGIELPSSTRAPLIMRPFDQELVLCKRQLRIVGMSGSGIAANTTDAYFAVEHSGMSTTPSVSATGVFTISDIFAANFAQSSANATILANEPDFGTYHLSNFTGLTVGRAYTMTASSAGRLKLSARP